MIEQRRTKWRHVVALFLIFGQYPNVNSDITVGPVDTEVKVNDSAYLRCSISNPSAEIQWLFYRIGEIRDPDHVFLNGYIHNGYNTSFRVDKDISTGSFDLVLTEAGLQNAGTYVCQNGGRGRGGLGKASSEAQLIVLEASPVCQSNIKPSGFIGQNSCDLSQETIHLSCIVSYKGNVPPELRWTRVKGNSSFPIPSSDVSCNSFDGASDRVQRSICNYTIKADTELDGSYFVCQTSRSKNAQYRCTTDTITVHKFAENKTRVAKTVGDEVTCPDNTRLPDCAYKWIWYDGDHQETVSEKRSLTINRRGLHRCEVNCNIKEFKCIFVAMKIEASVASEKTPNTNHIVAWIFGVSLSVCLVGLAAFLIRNYKRKAAKVFELQERLKAMDDEIKELRKQTELESRLVAINKDEGYEPSTPACSSFSSAVPSKFSSKRISKSSTSVGFENGYDSDR